MRTAHSLTRSLAHYYNHGRRDQTRDFAVPEETRRNRQINDAQGEPHVVRGWGVEVERGGGGRGVRG